MIGVSKQLATDLAARGYSEADVLRLFGPKAHRGELRIVYERTPWRRSHVWPAVVTSYGVLLQGLVAVAIQDEPPRRSRAALLSLPERIAQHAKADRRALYRRGDQEAVFTTRQHANLAAKGRASVCRSAKTTSRAGRAHDAEPRRGGARSIAGAR